MSVLERLAPERSHPYLRTALVVLGALIYGGFVVSYTGLPSSGGFGAALAAFLLAWLATTAGGGFLILAMSVPGRTDGMTIPPATFAERERTLLLVGGGVLVLASVAILTLPPSPQFLYALRGLGLALVGGALALDSRFARSWERVLGLVVVAYGLFIPASRIRTVTGFQTFILLSLSIPLFVVVAGYTRESGRNVRGADGG